MLFLAIFRVPKYTLFLPRLKKFRSRFRKKIFSTRGSCYPHFAHITSLTLIVNNFYSLVVKYTTYFIIRYSQIQRHIALYRYNKAVQKMKMVFYFDNFSVCWMPLRNSEGGVVQRSYFRRDVVFWILEHRNPQKQKFYILSNEWFQDNTSTDTINTPSRDEF